jgi:hypothetical protein
MAATYDDYLDTFLTADDAFFFDGDLDTARSLVEAGLLGQSGGGAASSPQPASASAAGPLSRREWTLARRAQQSRRCVAARPPRLRAGLPRQPRRDLGRLLLSDPDRLPLQGSCPLLALLARREKAVREGELAVVVFLRARNRAGQEVSAYVDLAARLGGGVSLVSGREGGEDEEEEDGEEEDKEDEDDGLDDGDEDEAERREAAADRTRRDASRGMAGVFARARPFLPEPTDLCYYNHATRRARANPTVSWQLVPSFGGGGAAAAAGSGGGESEGGGRLLLRHVRDRRVLDVGDASSPARTVVDLGGGDGAAAAATAAAAEGGGALTMFTDGEYLMQAVVFDHVVRRR